VLVVIIPCDVGLGYHYVITEIGQPVISKWYRDSGKAADKPDITDFEGWSILVRCLQYLEFRNEEFIVDTMQIY
jgi:hypothetical protein